MTSYLRKYVTALASARDYVANWSSEHVFADEELIVPFPTIAKFDPNKHVWVVDIKAWVYLPFQNIPLTNYLPSLPNIFTGSKTTENKPNESTNSDNEEKQSKESPSTSNDKDDHEKKDATATITIEKPQAKKPDGSSNEASSDSDDDDIYEDALRKNYFKLNKFYISI
jgi:hypothetical protein